MYLILTFYEMDQHKVENKSGRGHSNDFHNSLQIQIFSVEYMHVQIPSVDDWQMFLLGYLLASFAHLQTKTDAHE